MYRVPATTIPLRIENTPFEMELKILEKFVRVEDLVRPQKEFFYTNFRFAFANFSRGGRVVKRGRGGQVRGRKSDRRFEPSQIRRPAGFILCSPCWSVANCADERPDVYRPSFHELFLVAHLRSPSSLRRSLPAKCTGRFSSINMLRALSRGWTVPLFVCSRWIKFATTGERDTDGGSRYTERGNERRKWRTTPEKKRTAVGRKWVVKRGRREEGRNEKGNWRSEEDSFSSVTLPGQNRRSLESNYRYARWKLGDYLCSFFVRAPRLSLGSRTGKGQKKGFKKKKK